MAKKFPINPAHPERTCWGCDRYCPSDSLACGNGSERTQHPIELFGPGWDREGLDPVTKDDPEGQAGPSGLLGRRGADAQLRSLGPMYLRGKQEATEVFGVEWQEQRDSEATVMGASMFNPSNDGTLEVSAAGRTLGVQPRGEKLTLGRSINASLTINDGRVSREHATLEWRGGHFVLGDTSSFGTWVYFGNQSEPVVLRRTECYLVGSGQIALGCEREGEAAPLVRFNVRT